MSKPKKEKPTLTIGWCDNGSVDSLFMDGLLSLALSFNNNKNVKLGNLQHMLGNQIAKQRQQLFDEWVESGVDWLLWLDSDVVITPEIFDILWNTANKDTHPVVCGVYFVSPNPNQPMMIPVPCIFMNAENGGNDPVHPLQANVVIPIDVAGMGLVLMHRSIAPKLKAEFPDEVYFNIGLKENNEGEDVSFFRKLKKAGIPLYANTAALAPHIKRFVFDHTYYSVFWTMMSQKDKD